MSNMRLTDSTFQKVVQKDNLLIHFDKGDIAISFNFRPGGGGGGEEGGGSSMDKRRGGTWKNSRPPPPSSPPPLSYPPAPRTCSGHGAEKKSTVKKSSGITSRTYPT